jgi:hypothetical protein
MVKRHIIFPKGYPSRGLNEKEVAKILGISLSTLRIHRHKGRGLPYYKIGKAVRYDPVDILNFLEENKVSTKPI